MFARIVELFPRLEKKEEFLNIARSEILPILRAEPGFLELLPFVPELESERVIAVTIWAEKRDVSRFVLETLPRVMGIMKPYLLSPIVARDYVVESSLCPEFLQLLTA
jgi:hypothetical protein